MWRFGEGAGWGLSGVQPPASQPQNPDNESYNKFPRYAHDLPKILYPLSSGSVILVLVAALLRGKSVAIV